MSNSWHCVKESLNFIKLLLCHVVNKFFKFFISRVLFLFLVFITRSLFLTTRFLRFRRRFFIDDTIILFLLGVLFLSFLPESPVHGALWPSLENQPFVSGKNLGFSTQVSAFGFGLFTKYMLPLQIAGFMLLAAMVGVIILSKKQKETHL